MLACKPFENIKVAAAPDTVQANANQKSVLIGGSHFSPNKRNEILEPELNAPDKRPRPT